MSSHREAPEISKDPVADSTDVYAFVCPDHPDHVTLIANYVPLQAPDGGPNFYEFGDDVLYAINIDNNNDGDVDISYQFQFTSTITNPNTFLYNTGPDHQPDEPQLEPPPDLLDHPGRQARLPRPRHQHPLPALQHRAAVHPQLRQPGRRRPCTQLDDGFKVFAGQRAEGFYVDLGAIFDLGDLRPFEQAHNTFGLANTGLGKMAAGVNSTAGVNVHTIAIQVEINQLSGDGPPPHRGHRPERHHRRVDHGQPAEGPHLRGPARGQRQLGPLDPGVPAGQPAGQRGAHPHGRQGLLELASPRRATASSPPATRRRSWPASCPCSTRGSSPIWPPTTKPRADLLAILLTGIPSGRGPRLPELHRADPGRRAPPQHGHPGHHVPARPTSA